MTAREPSTTWRETIAPDEDERYARYATQFAELQRRKSAKFGNGRTLHRKQLLALRGKLEVFADIPAAAKHGLFAQPGQHDVLARFSNGGVDRAPDGRPDIRGMAVKVQGLPAAPSALGGTTTEQDFLLINQTTFNSKDSRDFIDLVVAAGTSPGALFGHLVRRYGFFASFGRARAMIKMLSKPFNGFAAEKLSIVLPIACGPYAIKVRVSPSHPQPPARDKNWARDLIERLENGDLSWDVQLQFYVDDTHTPIEDASVEWLESVTPWVTVGKLTLTKPPADGDLETSTEAAKFDPWNALAEHRPLGDVMRARKVVYYESQKGRGLT